MTDEAKLYWAQLALGLDDDATEVVVEINRLAELIEERNDLNDEVARLRGLDK